MKRSINVFLGVLLTAVFIAACAPAFEPELGTDYGRKAENTAQRYFTIAVTTPADVNTSGLLKAQPTAGLIDTQVIEITTSAYTFGSPTARPGYNLVIDETTRKISGIEVCPVSGTDVAKLVSHETALAYTAVYTGANKVELRLPFPRSTVSTKKVVLIADPDLVRFNGEGKHNTDRDTEPGEGKDKGNEDIYIWYYGKVEPSSLLTGQYATLANVNGQEHLQPAGNGLSFGPGVNEPPTLAPPSSNGLDKHQGTLLEIFAFEDTASTPSHGNFDKAALAAAYQFEKFDHDTKKWVTVTPTNPELDTSSGRLTLTFPAASQYDFYRYRVDRYQIAEKDPVQGYIHRWSYDQKAGYGIYEETYPNGLSNPPVWVWRPGEWLPLNFITDKTGNDAVEIGTFTDGSKYSASAGGIAGAYYIDVTVPNSSSSTNEDADLIASTLTPANIQVFYDEGGFDPTDNAVRKVDLTGAVFEKLGPREFRIKLPSSFVRSNTASATLEVRLHDVQVNYTKDIPGTDDYPLNNVKIFGLNNTGTLNISSIANFS